MFKSLEIVQQAVQFCTFFTVHQITRMENSILMILVCAPMNKLVYIVEDNPVQQKMLQVHFGQMVGNYSVKSFTDPEEMIAQIHENPFAVVLDHFFLDNDKTGLDYLKEIRKKYKKLPVIYYTSHDDEDTRKQVMKLGVEDYILKDSASLVRLRTALDLLNEKSSKRGILGRIFGK